MAAGWSVILNGQLRRRGCDFWAQFCWMASSLKMGYLQIAILTGTIMIVNDSQWIVNDSHWDWSRFCLFSDPKSYQALTTTKISASLWLSGCSIKLLKLVFVLVQRPIPKHPVETTVTFGWSQQIPTDAIGEVRRAVAERTAATANDDGGRQRARSKNVQKVSERITSLDGNHCYQATGLVVGLCKYDQICVLFLERR